MLLIAQPVFGLRCDGRIVQIGDKTTEVAKKCGQPDNIEYSQVERIREDYYYIRKHNRSKDYPYIPFIEKEIIQIEEWTYNFGPTKFIRYLFFEKDRLTIIEQGEKGYYR
jgi:hypothetical protein